MIRTKGAEAFQEILSNATPWLRYRINSTFKKGKLDEIEPRAAAIREVASLLSHEPDRLIRGEYINYIAERLKVSPDTIASEVKRESYYSKNTKGGEHKRITEKPTPKILTAESSILRLAIENKDVRSILKADLHWGEFSDPDMRSIAELLFNVDLEDEGKISTFLQENLPSNEAKKKLSELLVSEHPVHDQGAIRDLISTIKAHRIISRTTVLRKEMEEAEKGNDIERVKVLQREFQESNLILRELEKKH